MQSSPPLAGSPPPRIVSFLVVLTFIIGLIPISFAYLDPALRLTSDLSEGSPIRQAELLVLFLTVGWLLYKHQATAWAMVRHGNPFLLLCVLYCLVSALWSPTSMLTLKRAIILLGLLATAYAVAPPIGQVNQLTTIMRRTLTVICVLSMGVALAVPHIGVDYSLGGAWRGITWQKNLLGSVAAYATLLWLYAWTQRENSTPACAAGALFCLFMLLMTKSSTATLLTLMTCMVFLYSYRPWLSNRYFNPALLLMVAIAVILFVHFHFVATGQLPTWDSMIGPIAALFGKGTDLTGRTEIWQALLLAIQQHPLLGIGYDAFWLGVGSPAQFVADTLGWMPAHAHNGYLDLLNALGAVGLTLFGLALLWHLASIIRLMRDDRPQGALHLAILFLILTTNFTESDFLSGTQLQNIILLFSSATVSGCLYTLRRSHGTAGSTPTSRPPPPPPAAAAPLPTPDPAPLPPGHRPMPDLRITRVAPSPFRDEISP